MSRYMGCVLDEINRDMYKQPKKTRFKTVKSLGPLSPFILLQKLIRLVIFKEKCGV